MIPPTNPHPDSDSIEAIRKGEVDRFRDLIERHQRQVYAIAWAQLGDAALAEDAVQDSFIKAYRYLRWLRDPTRFAGWISRITRGVAINLGLRHRRELRRRERWSLDATTGSPAASLSASADTPTAEPDSTANPLPPERLHAALARLPARHRECLVLHYLDGHTITQAAAALSITEGAFKVRLHRARLALRVELEHDIELSLGRLAPRRNLVHGIMSGIAAKGAATDPAGLGAGWLTTAAASIPKVIPAGLLVAAVPFLAGALGLGIASWIARAEQANYRDPTGFHARQHARVRSQGVVLMLGIVCLVVLLPTLYQTIAPVLPETGLTFIGRLLTALLAIGLVIGAHHAVRDFQLRGDRRDLARNTSTLLLLATLGLRLVMDVPDGVHQAVFFVFLALQLLSPPDRILRHDTNLLLRLRLGHLRPSGANPDPAPIPRPLTPATIAAFGRLLASERLVTAFQRHPDGSSFTLSPTPGSHRPRLLSWWNRSSDSRVTLHTDGRVETRLGPIDIQALPTLAESEKPDSPIPTPAEAESRLTHAVREALDAFLDGNTPAALRHLGRQPDSEVFHLAPETTRARRFHRRLGAVLLLAFLITSTHGLWSRWLQGTPGPIPRPDVLQPVSVDLNQARELFATLPGQPTTNRHPGWILLERALYTGVLMPPADWATPDARSRIRHELLATWPVGRNTVEDRIRDLLDASAILKAHRFGWLEDQAFADLGITPASVRNTLKSLPPARRASALGPRERDGLHPPRPYLDVESLLERLAFLDRYACLDEVDPQPIAAELTRHQVVPGNPPIPDRPHHADRTIWAGLFATRGLDPVAETRDVLAALELLGQVPSIDREAAIAGLLRLHQGRGFFHYRWEDRAFTAADKKKPRPPLLLNGDARTTHAALDSLRILGALDRVPDHRSWDFCPLPIQMSGGRRVLRHFTWEQIEAGLLQARWTSPSSPGTPGQGR